MSSKTCLCNSLCALLVFKCTLFKKKCVSACVSVSAHMVVHGDDDGEEEDNL